MMIESIEQIPFHEIAYENVSSSRQVVVVSLPVVRARVDELPSGLDAIVVASDLQGLSLNSGDKDDRRLLGELLAEELAVLSELGELPPHDRIGVILAGDLFARLDRRGGYGDVRDVWRAFSSRFRWVAGVAGNHDIFSKMPSEPEFKAFVAEAGIYFLDGTVVSLDGLTLGGVSGIIGNPRKPFRRDEPSFVRAIKNVLAEKPSILVMHQNLDAVPNEKDIASHILEITHGYVSDFLVICGHRASDKPLLIYSNKLQVLNVNARAIILSQK